MPKMSFNKTNGFNFSAFFPKEVPVLWGSRVVGIPEGSSGTMHFTYYKDPFDPVVS